MSKKKVPPGTLEPFFPATDNKPTNKATPISGDVWQPPYSMTATGLYLLLEDGARPTYLCPPFEVVGQCSDLTGNSWGLLIRFKDPDKREKAIVIGRADLCNDRGEALSILASAGLMYPPGNAKRLKTALAALDPSARVTLVDQSGWVQPGGDYILGSEALIAPAISGRPLSVYHRTGDAPPIKVTGTFSAWQEHVSKPCIGNSRLILAACVAFAGPTLALLGGDGFGVHIRGTSSSGKTTALVIASSIAGVEVGTWRATGNGLEGVSTNANDGLLILDELAEVSAHEAAPVVYMLGNGQGKARSTRTGEAGKRKKWLAAMLSSGEISLAQKVSEANSKATVKAGQEVRLIDIEADAGKGLGAFEWVPDGIAPGAFSDGLKASAKANSGHAFPLFIAALQSDQGDKVRNLHQHLHGALKDRWPDINGQASRVRDRFAMIATAGEYATENKITGWPPGQATMAAMACFETWLAPRAVGNHESRAAIEAVRAIIQIHGANRFQVGDDDVERPIPLVLGYKREFEHKLYYCFLSEPWKREVMSGLDHNAGARFLYDAGLLETDKPSPDGKKRYTKKITTKAGRQGTYAVCASILENEDI